MLFSACGSVRVRFRDRVRVKDGNSVISTLFSVQHLRKITVSKFKYEFRYIITTLPFIQ